MYPCFVDRGHTTTTLGTPLSYHLCHNHAYSGADPALFALGRNAGDSGEVRERPLLSAHY